MLDLVTERPSRQFSRPSIAERQIMTAHVMMLADPKWHCRIGRVQLKPGASIICDSLCGSFF